MNRNSKNDGNCKTGGNNCPNKVYAKSGAENEEIRDFGGHPYAVNISQATRLNNAFRRALWTGGLLQLTLMSIPAGGEIGLENHAHTDQFLRIEQGSGRIKMGSRKDAMSYEKVVGPGSGIFVPAGTWHNLTNVGRGPLKLYSIYAPPQHPKGTLEQTKNSSNHH